MSFRILTAVIKCERLAQDPDASFSKLKSDSPCLLDEIQHLMPLISCDQWKETGDKNIFTPDKIELVAKHLQNWFKAKWRSLQKTWFIYKYSLMFQYSFEKKNVSNISKITATTWNQCIIYVAKIVDDRNQNINQTWKTSLVDNKN